MTARAFAVLLAAGVALAGCGRGADSGATSNANAPGSPGTGNAATASRPLAGEGPPGGPSGVKGSAPHTGASGGDPVPGTTGSGASETGGRSQTAQPGVGTTGGLGGTTAMGAAGSQGATDGAGAASRGSSNSTPDGAVGRR
ncbi:MAG TPA: hypothetical protein VEA35_06510 [Ramlibacter sp.]|nr:hypothetical protein [Ramlibacter sp.]